MAAFCGQCGTLSVKKPKWQGGGGKRGLCRAKGVQSKAQEAGRVGHGEGEAAHAKKCAGHGSSRSISQDFRMLLPLVGPHKRTSRTWSAINVNVEIFMMQPPSAQRVAQRVAGSRRGEARGECATLFMRYLRMSFERNLNNPVQGTRTQALAHTGTQAHRETALCPPSTGCGPGHKSNISISVK